MLPRGSIDRTFWVDASLYGLAVVADNGDTRWKAAAHTGHTTLDELYAIRLALDWAAELQIKRALILCDSTSAVKAIHGVNNGKGPTRLREVLDRVLPDLGNHVVAWVPRQANAAANAAARRTAGGADPWDR